MTTTIAHQAFATVQQLLDAPCACPLDPAIDDLQGYLDQASDILAYLSGGRMVGTRSATVRPVRNERFGFGFPHQMRDRERLSFMFGSMFGCWTPIRLRIGATVTDIKVDGVALAKPGSWAIVDSNLLIRTDGLDWPVHQNLLKPDTEVGTWSITFTYGLAPDMVTRQATTELACELAKADGIGGKVGYAPGTNAVNIQGASVSIQDRAEALAEGRELLPNLSRFLGIYAPDGRHATEVYSPELEGAYRLVEVAYS